MRECTHCGRLADEHQTECPSCFKPLSAGRKGTDRRADDLSDVSPAEWTGPSTPIARFANAAEAGYFAHELREVAAIPTAVNIDEHFDALSGLWSTRFVLTVPDAVTNEARGVLQTLIAESESAEDHGGDGGFDADEPEPADAPTDMGPQRVAVTAELADDQYPTDDGGVNWVPILLTLTAGSVAFWAGQTFRQAGRPAVEADRERINGTDFLGHLQAAPHPWTQRTADGRGVRELRFDRDLELVIIREDADGDGEFERIIPFRADSLH